uniref:uncharacterized protein LOC100181347 isoform X1 n=1 Tax=Ciona intestinalis TaxID=7719 RepID=UPI000180C318|nr:uncharacterized protein LOC100181347 isoform X1 [Ciona intestinalis]|eukprot:XP_002131661.1 uncharacterized protein LOC100181347 isoform X1 [Ciona intestinalis]
MSGYFVHAGTQYPFGQTPNQPQQQQQQQSSSTTSNNSNTAGSAQSYYSNYGNTTSYPNQSASSQTQGNSSQYTYGQNSSSYGSNSGYNSSQYNNSTSSFGVSTQSGNNFGSNTARSNLTNTGYGTSQSSGNYASTYGTQQSSGSGFPTTYGGASNTGSNNLKMENYGYSFEKSTDSTTNQSYEKALLSAANQYYSSSRRGRGTRGSFAGTGRGRGKSTRRGFGQSHQAQSSGPKAIKASEIKAYLYAWCGQRKLKPEYEVLPQGQVQLPRTMFTCKLHITGLDYVAEAQAPNKKDAQGKAAWNFCENLVKTGYMKASELPPRPAQPVPKSQGVSTTPEAGSYPAEIKPEVEDHGGWTLANCRQRLNQFCQREHTSPDFKHETHGPEHARIFVCELKLNVSSVQKVLLASERGSNKKQATAVCALSMIRQLYKERLIEKCGDPIKHVTRGGLLGSKTSTATTSVKTDVEPKVTLTEGNANAGLKRKADDKVSPDSVDENGNWTIDNSRQRLNQFCQVNNIHCDVMYEEEGAPGSRVYTASLDIKVTQDNSNDQTVAAKARGPNKKAASQGCALKILSQLYKLKLVEANDAADPGHPNKRKTQRGRGMTGKKRQIQSHLIITRYSTTISYRIKPKKDGPGYMPAYGGMQNFHSFDQGSDFNIGFPVHGPWTAPVHRTALSDAHINAKHKQIYPSEQKLEVAQRCVKMVELALKEVAEELETLDTKPEPLDDTVADGPKKRKLQGVMRVGYLAKGLLIDTDDAVDLVLLCLEPPTAKLLIQIAQMLPKHIKDSDGEKSNVETSMMDAAIKVQIFGAGGSSDVKLCITIHLTSPAVRTPAEEVIKDAPGTLNKDKCLQSLAQLRHAKWFQACANVIPSCVVVIRILRDLKRRDQCWAVLSDWAIELLVERSLYTSPAPLSLGGSLQRVMEVVSAGIILEGSGGLRDPCERDDVDVVDQLTEQQREELTRSAQTYLRCLVFRKPHKVLGMEALPKPEWLIRKTEAISMN